jgi:predicted CopG family antitoxin
MSLSDDQIRRYIMKESGEHEELNSKEKLFKLIGFSSPSQPSNNNHSVKGYRPFPRVQLFLALLKRDDLIRLALKAERVHKKATGTQGPKGGLHDYIWRLTDDEIRKIILKWSNEHVELDSPEKLRTLLNQPDEIIPPKPSDQPIDSSVNKYLISLSREDLLKLAYETEKVHKKSIGAEGTVGGLHDYAWRLPDDEIRKIIMKEAQEHQEINSKEKLMTLLENHLIFLTSQPTNNEIKNYLLTLERKDLEKLAYATEKVHKKSIGAEGTEGGLHDYIWRLSEDEIRDIIINETEEHEQLNSKEKLITLLGSAPNLKITSDEIKNYLLTLNRDDLIRLASKTEKVHKTATGEGRFGGLHDYIMNLSDEQIRRYIMKESDDHVEINSKEKLMALIQPSDPKMNQYLLSLSREDLIKLAYETEKIHKKAIGIEGSIGGLHDYIWRLSDDDIRKIVMKESQEHQEINSVEQLKMLIDNHNSNITLLSTDLINKVHEKVNLKKNVKLLGPISTLINISSKRMLMKILLKCLDTINFQDEEVLKNLEFEQMEVNHLRKFMKNLIRRHADKLNKEEIFKDFIEY